MPKKIDKKQIPRYTDLIVPVFLALKDLGGSGNNDEILSCVISNLHLPDDVVDFPHKGRTSISELAYQLARARTYLKSYGVVENSARAVWSIRSEFAQESTLDAKHIVQTVVTNNRQKRIYGGPSNRE